MSTDFADLVLTWRAVSGTRSRTAKVGLLAEHLRRLSPRRGALAAAWLSGQTVQGRIGVGPASLQAAGDEPLSSDQDAGIDDVDRALTELAGMSGPGSVARRDTRLRALFSRMSPEQREFLVRLLLGNLRQGALDGLMVDAIAVAADLDIGLVRRAMLLSGSLPDVARAALEGGSTELSGFDLVLFRPLQPMLAQTASDVEDALARLGRAALEYKLDGARIQVHRVGNDVRIYTRNLNDVTESLPDVVETVLRLPSRELILDGEAIALRPDGTPLPFQVTMRRFGRRKDVASLRESLPLQCFFFDALRADGHTLIDRPAAERFEALEELVPESVRVRRVVTANVSQARSFLGDARRIGHEGIIAKALDAIWDAGGRGAGWLKIKPVHTLDLVVLAAEWGHGRRRGRLSNLHLGARSDSGFVMLGKTFKGLTDRMLEWQTAELLARETSRSSHTVHVRPELVVEIAFNDVQESRRYPGGLALRFARVKGYREDKTAAEADTIDTVRAIHAGQTGTPD